MSDPTVYAIASGKGGVGKTTLTINLGAALAARGRTTVVVDADLGMANLATFLDLDVEGPTLHDVLADAVVVQEATYGVEEGFAVVPGGTSLERFAEAETAALGDAIEGLRKAFDVVLIDVGAGLSHDTVLPMGLADAVLLAATPDLAAVENAAKTKELAARLDRDVVGIVLTRAGSQFDLDPETVESELDVPVLAIIPEDEAVQASVHAGAPVVVTDPEAPASVGYSGLAAVLDGDESVSIPVRPAFGEAAEVAVDTAGDDQPSAAEAAVAEGDADSAAEPEEEPIATDGSAEEEEEEESMDGSEVPDADTDDEGDTTADSDGPEDGNDTEGMVVEPARSNEEDTGDRGFFRRLFDRL